MPEDEDADKARLIVKHHSSPPSSKGTVFKNKKACLSLRCCCPWEIPVDVISRTAWIFSSYSSAEAWPASTRVAIVPTKKPKNVSYLTGRFAGVSQWFLSSTRQRSFLGASHLTRVGGGHLAGFPD